MELSFYIVLGEFYSVLRKREILAFATTQTDFEGIMLNEIRQIDV